MWNRFLSVRRHTALTLLAACGLAVPSSFAAPPQPLAAKSAVAPAQQTKTVRQLLNQRIARVNFEEVALNDAIEFIRDVAGVNLHVNWKALEAAGIGKDSPVTVKLRNISVRKALTAILTQASPDTPLSFYNDQGVLEITTRDLSDAQQVVRTYFVGDLVVDVPDFAGPQLNMTASSKGNGGGGTGQGIFDTQNKSDRDKPATKAERANNLVTLITQVIRPDVWEANGGTAKISYFNGYLIVTAPRSVHEQIGGPVD